MLYSAVTTLALAAAASALPSAPQKRWLPGYDNSRIGPDNADCVRTQYSIPATSMNVDFLNLDSNANETILTSLLQTFVASLPVSTNFSSMYEAPNKTAVSNTYSISGTFCYPKANKVQGAVQLLVHGIGFDSSYWDFALSEEYSYVRAAADAGYTTFRYDRLGTGNSEHPADAYNVVQGATDLAIATKFASMLRDGSLDGTSYGKILGVGHSYGSVQMEALAATSPSLVDGLILQGFSANTSFAPLYLTSTAYSTATDIFPNRFPKSSELTNAYLVTGLPQTNQLNFFTWPYYSNAAFDLSRQTEQPVTQGVLFTFAGLVAPAPQFTGPVLVATGDSDWIFCGQNCYAVPPNSTRASILDYVKDLFPAVNDFSTYIPAFTGHAVNQHYSAPETYQAMLAWAKARIM